VLLVAAGAATGVRFGTAGMIVIYCVAAISVATNVVLLRDGAGQLRDAYAPTVRAELAGLELAGSGANPGFDLTGTGTGSGADIAFASIAEIGLAPTRAYLEAADRYGALGLSVAELRAAEPAVRARADAALVGALDLEIVPTPAPAARRSCRDLEPGPDGSVSFQLPSGGALLEARGAAGSANLRRFGDPASAIEVGRLVPGQPGILRVPPHAASDPWLGSASTTSVRICDLT
jgi:hypothetical protein